MLLTLLFFAVNLLQYHIMISILSNDLNVRPSALKLYKIKNAYEWLNISNANYSMSIYVQLCWIMGRLAYETFLIGW